MTNEIYEAALERGITRLCHFTRIESAAAIFKDGYIRSQEDAEQHGIQLLINDEKRQDRQLSSVSLTIEYPNRALLSTYRDRFEGQTDGWVVLEICPTVLKSSNLQFCPVNAAKGSGAFIEETGTLAGFESLFANVPPEIEGGRKRTEQHLECCPTDLQAEILVAERIATDNVNLLYLQSDGEREELLKLFLSEGVNASVPIGVWRHPFKVKEWSEHVPRGNRIGFDKGFHLNMEDRH